jgi:hypothetical protein
MPATGRVWSRGSQKYDRMPAEMKSAMAGTSAIPVDVEPVFPFADDVR